MTVPPAPKFVIVDDFLTGELIAALDELVRADQRMELMEFGGTPEQGAYSALRKLWVLEGSLGPLEPAFRAAVMDRFAELCAGTGVAPFDVARVETEVCAQSSGSFFAKHVDTDVGDAREALATDRLISSVYYFPREPLAFSGGELVLYDFTGKTPSARIAPRRNRLVAFPSFAYHEVMPITESDGTFDGARWSVNCWLHRAKQVSG
jgi:Rps23 Pro-64 3,4-dihydroxylase Tpa1-like proline 4-hydroxylase